MGEIFGLKMVKVLMYCASSTSRLLLTCSILRVLRQSGVPP